MVSLRVTLKILQSCKHYELVTLFQITQYVTTFFNNWKTLFFLTLLMRKSKWMCTHFFSKWTNVHTYKLYLLINICILEKHTSYRLTRRTGFLYARSDSPHTSPSYYAIRRAAHLKLPSSPSHGRNSGIDRVWCHMSVMSTHMSHVWHISCLGALRACGTLW